MRVVVAGLVVATLAGVGVVALTRHGDTYVVPPAPEAPGARAGTVAGDPPDAGLAAAAVVGLEDALRRRDPAAAAALAPADDPAAQRALAALARNARALDLTGVRLRFVDTAAVPDADGAFRAVVEVSWQIAGFDPRPATTEVSFRLRQDGDRVVLLGAGGGGHRSPLWLTGPVAVQRSGDALVIAARRSAVPRYAGLARVAIATVDRELDLPDTRLVVEVPATEPQLDGMLDARRGTYAGIAAVTAPVDGSTSAGAPAHVFVNPDQFDRLRRAGAQVVMTHETTHAATGAVTSQAPLWLVEGFADWVALQEVDLPLSTTAAELIARIRRHGIPRALPGTADFDVAATDLDATYEAAWLACVTLADRAGPAALERVYAEASSGQPIEQVLRRDAGLSAAELTVAWRSRLSDLRP